MRTIALLLAVAVPSVARAYLGFIAGNPDAVPARSWDQVAPAARLTSAALTARLELEQDEAFAPIRLRAA